MPSRVLLLLSMVKVMALPSPAENCLPSTLPSSILICAVAPVPMAVFDAFCAAVARVWPCASCFTSMAYVPLTALSLVVAFSTPAVLEVAEVARPLPAMFCATPWNLASADCSWPSADNLVWSRVRLLLSLVTPVFCDSICFSTLAYTSAEGAVWVAVLVYALLLMVELNMVVVPSDVIHNTRYHC